MRMCFSYCNIKYGNICGWVLVLVSSVYNLSTLSDFYYKLATSCRRIFKKIKVYSLQYYNIIVVEKMMGIDYGIGTYQDEWWGKDELNDKMQLWKNGGSI